MGKKGRKQERADSNIRRKWKPKGKFKDIVTEMKNFFDKFISRHDMAKKESVNLKIGQ